AGERIIDLAAELRHLVGGVLRIAAAVVEEVADVVRPEDLQQALVLRAVLIQPLQLVAAGPEGTGGRVPQRRDRLVALQAGVDQLLAQRPDDAVAAGVDLAELAAAPG